MNESQERKGFKELLVETIIPKVEKISLAVFAAGSLLLLANIPGGRNASAIALNTLALTYFVTPYLYNKGNHVNTDLIVLKIGFIASSIIMIGSMYALLGFRGADQMLNIGLIASAIATLFLTYRIYSNTIDSLKEPWVRLVIGLVIGFLHYSVYL